MSPATYETHWMRMYELVSVGDPFLLGTGVNLLAMCVVLYVLQLKMGGQLPPYHCVPRLLNTIRMPPMPS